MSKMTQYMQFIHCSKYARWLPEEGRRETWEETVTRYTDFFSNTLGNKKEELELKKAILEMEVMPSMRCLMTAGKALERDNVAGYNCSYCAVESVRVFHEIMYVLMCGTGVGFSVERQYVSRLPRVPQTLRREGGVISVADSKIGWCNAFGKLLRGLYSGEVYEWDTSKVRPTGSPLKTFGGRSSGEKPLRDLFKFTVDLFTDATGRQLTSLECHDLVCKVAEVVVVGGVRRSALISLSNLSDDRLRGAKQGAWFEDEPQRALANNSAVYTDKPDLNVFLKEWVSLYESRAGERGIFSRLASQNQARRNGRRDSNWDFGTNPCSEIILRPDQFCNLSEVVARVSDSIADLKRKVRMATILGTLQSTLTFFRYLSKSWKVNTEEERLLGVSLTGIMDHPVLNGSQGKEKLKTWLKVLKDEAIKTNKEYAERFGIPQSTAITCVKPSGTVSQLVDSSSGIHSRFSPFYIRRVRADVKDPLTKLMKDSGIPWEPVIGQENSTVVFSFPHKAPVGAKCVSSDTAIEQLEMWSIYQEFWCEHKPSITVYYDDKEFLEVGAWVYKNFEELSGVSFLPKSNHVYAQAPYEEITEDHYEKIKDIPLIDFSLLSEYEKEDQTKGTQELACSAGVCEIVDL